MDFHPTSTTTKTTHETVAVLRDAFEYTAYGETYVYPAGHEFRFKGRNAPKLVAAGVVLPLGHGADVVVPRSAFVLYQYETTTVTKVETTVTRTIKS